MNVLIKSIENWKNRKFEQTCQGLYKPGDRVLDLGAGDCLVAQHLKNKFQVEMVCIDVKDNNRSELPLIKYNGKKIPFSDEYFDAVNLFFVLHHADDPISLLREAKRVTKNKIIIIEDTYNTILGGIICRCLDWFLNLGFCSTPFNFKTEKEWKEVFEKEKLKLVYSRKKRMWFYPVTQIKFILEKQ